MQSPAVATLPPFGVLLIRPCRLITTAAAWQEWEPWETDVAVPLSPGELQQKIDAIWKHQSQVGGVLGAGGVPSVGRACRCGSLPADLPMSLLHLLLGMPARPPPPPSAPGAGARRRSCLGVCCAAAEGPRSVPGGRPSGVLAAGAGPQPRNRRPVRQAGAAGWLAPHSLATLLSMLLHLGAVCDVSACVCYCFPFGLERGAVAFASFLLPATCCCSPCPAGWAWLSMKARRPSGATTLPTQAACTAGPSPRWGRHRRVGWAAGMLTWRGLRQARPGRGRPAWGRQGLINVLQ